MQETRGSRALNAGQRDASGSSRVPPPRSPSLRRAAHQLLSRDECATFKAALRAFRETTTAEQLVDSLAPVIDSPRKLGLLRDIALLLPASQRADFVRLARRRFPGCERLLPHGNGEAASFGGEHAKCENHDGDGDWPPAITDEKITLAESAHVRRFKGEVERPRVIKLNAATFQVRYRSRLASTSSASHSASSTSAASVSISNSSQDSPPLRLQHQDQQHLQPPPPSTSTSIGAPGRARAASVTGLLGRRDSTASVGGGFGGSIGFFGGPQDKGFWALNSPRRGLQELRRQERLQVLGAEAAAAAATAKLHNGSGSTLSLAPTSLSKPGVSFMLSNETMSAEPGRYRVPAPGRVSTPGSPLVRSAAASASVGQQLLRPRAFSVLTSAHRPATSALEVSDSGTGSEEKVRIELADISSGKTFEKLEADEVLTVTTGYRGEPDSWDKQAGATHSRLQDEATLDKMEARETQKLEAPDKAPQGGRSPQINHRAAAEELRQVNSTLVTANTSPKRTQQTLIQPDRGYTVTKEPHQSNSNQAMHRSPTGETAPGETRPNTGTRKSVTYRATAADEEQQSYSAKVQHEVSTDDTHPVTRDKSVTRSTASNELPKPTKKTDNKQVLHKELPEETYHKAGSKPVRRKASACEAYPTEGFILQKEKAMSSRAPESDCAIDEAASKLADKRAASMETPKKDQVSKRTTPVASSGDTSVSGGKKSDPGVLQGSNQTAGGGGTRSQASPGGSRGSRRQRHHSGSRWTQTEPPAQLETSACQTEDTIAASVSTEPSNDVVQPVLMSPDQGGCSASGSNILGSDSIRDHKRPAGTQTSPDIKPASAWPPWRCRHHSTEPEAGVKPADISQPAYHCSPHSPQLPSAVPQSASMPADLVLQWLAGHMMAQAAAAAAAAAATTSSQEQQQQFINRRAVTLKRDSNCQQRCQSQVQQHQQQHQFGISVARGGPKKAPDSTQPSSSVVVSSVAIGSPAHQMGIQPGDEILEVDGAPVDTMTLQQLAEAISQQKTVSLLVIRPSREHD